MKPNTHARGASVVQDWDSLRLNVTARPFAGALRRGQQGFILEESEETQTELRMLHQDAWSHKPSLWGHSSDAHRQAEQPSPMATCWLAAALPQPPGVDHGGQHACSCRGSRCWLLSFLRLHCSPSHSCHSSFTPWLWHAAAAGYRHSSLTRALCVAIYFWLGVRVDGRKETENSPPVRERCLLFLLASIAPRPYRIMGQGPSPWTGLC